MRRLMWLAVAAMLAMVTAVGSAGVAQAAYPGRNGRIAYTWHEQVYTINPNGAGVRKLTSSGLNTHPKWSPDGRRIAYVRETADGVRRIWVMNADGSNKQRITSDSFDTAPSWSPDGRWLVYGAPSDQPYTGTTLHTIRSTRPYGAPVELLGYTEHPEYLETLDVDTSVAWSADGKHIIYYSHSYPSSPDNYILSYDTSTRQIDSLMATGGSCCGGGYFTDVAISASGTRIGVSNYTYDYETSGPPKRPFVTIWKYDPSIDNLTGTVTTAVVRGDKQPAFAPAGDHVVLENGSSGTARLFVTGPALGNRRFLTNGYLPDWQPVR